LTVVIAVYFPKSFVFLLWKTGDFGKYTPMERSIVTLLQDGEVSFPPLSLEVLAVEPRTPVGLADAMIGLGWSREQFRFVAECKRSWTPKAVAAMAAHAIKMAQPPDTYPLVIVPYLSDERLRQLQAEGVAGIDLCGNGVVVVPGELLVYRTGQPNKFRAEGRIKNVFRGDSSLVARAFLLRPAFDSLDALRREVVSRGGRVVLSTVSKVCHSLVEQLIVARTGSGRAARSFRLLQAEKLLDALAANAVSPDVTRSVRGKAKLGAEVIRERLTGVAAVQTGLSSVGSYAVMAKELTREYYCTGLDDTLRALGDAFEQTERFADTVLLETTDATVYFDRRPGLVASPIQVYLELMLGDKRSRETAEQVRKHILAPLKPDGGA